MSKSTLRLKQTKFAEFPKIVNSRQFLACEFTYTEIWDLKFSRIHDSRRLCIWFSVCVIQSMYINPFFI